MIWTSCGCLVATRAEFQQSVGTIQLISGDKDWKHVSVQKVVTLNICCNITCLQFHLPHNWFFSEPPMPTHNQLFSEPPTFGVMQHTFSQMKKLCTTNLCDGAQMATFGNFWVLYFQRAARGTFQTFILNSH